jgi:hypothetical protein
VTKTKQLLDKAVLIRHEAGKQMEIDYPIGMEVTWSHGNQLRRGKIESYAYGAAIFVRTVRNARVHMEITKVRE